VSMKTIDEHKGRVRDDQRTASKSCSGSSQRRRPRSRNAPATGSRPVAGVVSSLVGSAQQSQTHGVLDLFDGTPPASFAADLAGCDVSKGQMRPQPGNPLRNGLVTNQVETRLAECAAPDTANGAGQ
jgi:hypothetical protein